jgi:hypothetical protein
MSVRVPSLRVIPLRHGGNFIPLAPARKKKSYVFTTQRFFFCMIFFPSDSENKHGFADRKAPREEENWAEK